MHESDYSHVDGEVQFREYKVLTKGVNILYMSWVLKYCGEHETVQK